MVSYQDIQLDGYAYSVATTLSHMDDLGLCSRVDFAKVPISISFILPVIMLTSACANAIAKYGENRHDWL